MKALFSLGALLLSTAPFLFSASINTPGSVGIQAGIVSNPSDVSDQSFITAGPIRAGYFATSYLDYAIYLPDSLSPGAYGLKSPGPAPTPDQSLGEEVLVTPVALGVPLTMEVNAPFPGDDHWYSYSYDFYEADGKTPVAITAINPTTAITAAPEPAAWGLLGLSLGGFALLKKRRQA